MNWITIALASAAISGFINITDKTVIHQFSRSPLTLPFLIGIAQTSLSIVILLATGIPIEQQLPSVLYALLSGILFGLSGMILLTVLFSQEVSRTIPVSQSAPIFGAILAAILLNEVINVVQWFGIILTVIGSMVLSLRKELGVERIYLHKSFYLLMFSAFLFGAATVVGKSAVDILPVLTTHGLRMFALGTIMLGFALRGPSLADFRLFITEKKRALLLVGMNEFCLATVGTVLFLVALSYGPASLVLALYGTRALFVVVYSTCLSYLVKGVIGEQLSVKTVVIKGISTCTIVSGVAAITLG